MWAEWRWELISEAIIRELVGGGGLFRLLKSKWEFGVSRGLQRLYLGGFMGAKKARLQ